MSIYFELRSWIIIEEFNKQQLVSFMVYKFPNED